jgi:methylated-DNA-[protein]-cysteine S-methyltransferase
VEVKMIGFAAVEAPWGPIHLAADADGLVALEVLTTPEAFAGSVRRRLGETPVASTTGPAARRLRTAIEAVEAYLVGQPEALAEVPFALHGLSAWDRLVLDGVRQLPWGETIGYGGLARAIGRAGAARAVGGAVGRNPIGLVVPCHRVIAGDGSLGGYGGSWFGDREALLAIKRQLLAHEGNDPTGGALVWTTLGARAR